MSDFIASRIISVGIEIDRVLNIYKDLDVSVVGEKTTSARNDTCEINIKGIKQENLANLTNYFYDTNKPIRVRVEYGREGSPLSLLYFGETLNSESKGSAVDVLSNSIKLICGTGVTGKNKLTSVSLPKGVSLQEASQDIAKSLGVGLKFDASNVSLNGFVLNSDAYSGIEKLNKNVNINAFLDGEFLVVKNKNGVRDNQVIVLNKNSGMLGVPKRLATSKPKTATEKQSQIEVSWLADRVPVVGGAVRIESERVPSANGLWIIDKLRFNLENRANNWFFTAECTKYD